MSTFQFESIGVIQSCFKEKFGIPRQPGLAPSATAVLELLKPFAQEDAVKGLEQMSHVWLQFVFHQSMAQQWKPMVRPPRLGGNQRLGVFATRSPVRPNSIGLSVVKLDKIDVTDGVTLFLSGIDLLDGTPVLDIKPYIPYVDNVEGAFNCIAADAPDILTVTFSDHARSFCDEHKRNNHLDLITLITQVLQQDPRPQYQRPDPERSYGMRLYDLDVRWHYRQNMQGESDDGQAWLIEVYEIVSVVE